MKRTLVGLGAAALLTATPLAAQTFVMDEPVLAAIWREGTQNSHLERLSQALMDSVGPRLNASPEHLRGNEWLVSTYRGWGIEARNEQYGTWRRWRRGPSHIDLVQPRVRSLEGMLLAWSHGTQRDA